MAVTPLALTPAHRITLSNGSLQVSWRPSRFRRAWSRARAVKLGESRLVLRVDQPQNVVNDALGVEQTHGAFLRF